MKIEINNSNRADVAMKFESVAEVIKEQSSQSTSTAVNFFKAGVIVEVEGTTNRQLPLGVAVPDDACFGRYGILIHDGKLKIMKS